MENPFVGYIYWYDGLNETEIEEKLYSDILDALHKKYGAFPDTLIVKRVQEEWDAIKRMDFVLETAFLNEFTSWLRKEHYGYDLSLHLIGGSIIFYLLKICAVNPLPAHLYCEQCHTVQWFDEYADGFDILPDLCAFDGCKRFGDGHNLIFWPLEKQGMKLERTFNLDIPNCFEDYIGDFFTKHWIGLLELFQIEYVKEEYAGYEKYYISDYFVGEMLISCWFNKKKVDYDLILDSRCLEIIQILWLSEQFKIWAEEDCNVMKIRQPRSFTELIKNLEFTKGSDYGLPPWEILNLLYQQKEFSTEKLLVYKEEVYDFLQKYKYPKKTSLGIIRGDLPMPMELKNEIIKTGTVWLYYHVHYYCREKLIHDLRNKVVDLDMIFWKIRLMESESNDVSL